MIDPDRDPNAMALRLIELRDCDHPRLKSRRDAWVSELWRCGLPDPHDMRGARGYGPEDLVCAILKVSGWAPPRPGTSSDLLGAMASIEQAGLPWMIRELERAIAPSTNQQQ